MLARLMENYRTLRTLLDLPVAQLTFDRRLNPREVTDTYRRFTAPHPRYRLIRHKTIGVALLPLCRYGSPASYLAWLKDHSKCVAQAKKARGLGYRLRQIERNAYVDDIHAINTSLTVRQGRPMSANYLQKTEHFATEPNFRYFGVFNPDGQLVAYCNMASYGNFAAFAQLIGYRNNDGAMHLMIIDIICQLLEQGGHDYLMYDTYFGAQTGMQRFKKMFGFSPYRVRYELV